MAYSIEETTATTSHKKPIIRKTTRPIYKQEL